MNQRSSTAPRTGAFASVVSGERVYEIARAMPQLPSPHYAIQQRVAGITFTPGGVRTWRRDWDAMNRTVDRAQERALSEDPRMTIEATRPSRGAIKEWSLASRANMGWVIGAVDFKPFIDLVADGRAPALVTLTLPGDWLTVAPSGEVFKKLVNKLRRRYYSAWGRQDDMTGVWKLEFQRRGAPHFHLLTVPPIGLSAGRDFKGLDFKTWLSLTWADVVDHPDPEQRAKHVAAGTNVDYADMLRYGDPKRIAVYFTKHGTFRDKEYQNVVPEPWREPGKGPGRFWGVWHLEVVKANLVVPDNAQTAVNRYLRGYDDRRSYSRKVRDVPGWTHRGTGEIHSPRKRKRAVNRRVKRLRRSAGYILVNDIEAVAADVARIVAAVIRDGDFFGATPDHLASRVSAFHERHDSDSAFESEELGDAYLDHQRRRLLALQRERKKLAPLRARADGESDVFDDDSSRGILASMSEQELSELPPRMADSIRASGRYVIYHDDEAF